MHSVTVMIDQITQYKLSVEYESEIILCVFHFLLFYYVCRVREIAFIRHHETTKNQEKREEEKTFPRYTMLLRSQQT